MSANRSPHETPEVGCCNHARHRHFWQSALSRRQFMGTAAGAAGAALTADLWLPLFAEAQGLGGAAPKPLPGGIQPFGPGTEVFHLNLPAPGMNPSTITDFNGVVAFTEVQGTGTGTDTTTGATTPLLFDVDVRFFDGVYLGADGKSHQGTFGFF